MLAKVPSAQFKTQHNLWIVEGEICSHSLAQDDLLKSGETNRNMNASNTHYGGQTPRAPKLVPGSGFSEPTRGNQD